MLKREYGRKHITLPTKFWNLPNYKAKFQFQMRLASKLIRTYGEQAVQTVIDRETWCYSLAAKTLPDMMEIEANNIKKSEMIEELSQKPKEVENIEDVPVWRPPNTSKKSILDE